MAPHHGWFGSSINGNCKRIAGPLVLLGEPRGRGERSAGLGAAGWVSSRKRGPPTLHSCAASERRGARLAPGQGRDHQGRWDVALLGSRKLKPGNALSGPGAIDCFKPGI